jgi:hypothetical protein
MCNTHILSCNNKNIIVLIENYLNIEEITYINNKLDNKANFIAKIISIYDTPSVLQSDKRYTIIYS